MHKYESVIQSGTQLRQIILLATALFLIVAPWPDALEIAELTAGFVANQTF